METVGEQWHILTTKEMLAISSNPPGKSKFDPIVVHFGLFFLRSFTMHYSEIKTVTLSKYLARDSSQGGVVSCRVKIKSIS